MSNFDSESLPDRPLYRNAPSGSSWVSLNLKNLWAYHELFFFLTWRDVKVRYKQTLLGAAWAIIQPLFTMLIFTLVFSALARIPSDNIPYPLFAYAGLLPWTFFANATTASGQSLIGNTNLITKVYFPRLIIPCASVGAGALDFVIAFVVLIGLMIFYGVGLTWRVLLLPPLMLLTVFVALGVGLWMSALNVRYRDVRHALPFLIQLWMFASPVIYPTSIVPAKWRWILLLNPLTGIIEGFRAALFHRQEFDWMALAASASITLILLIYSTHVFRRMERSFADFI